MDIKKLLVCCITSVCIFISCFSNLSASAEMEITYEQEMLIYFNANSDKYEQGIPYLPKYFQGLYGWNNCKPAWDMFLQSSNYPNRLYYTTELYEGKTKYFYIINYDYISWYNSNSVKFHKCIIAYFSTLTSTYETVNLTLQGNYNTSDNDFLFQMFTNYSGFTKAYYSFSINGQSLILDDGQILRESINEDKDTGIAQGLGKLLSGGFSLMDNSLLEVNAEDFQLLGSLFNAELSASLGVEVGDDTYNEIVTDLTNNTTNSSYWSQIDKSTQNKINNTYSNLKICFDNSVTVYNNDAGDYYYMPSTTTSSNDSYPNYSTYVSNGGDIADYFNTYIKSNVSGDGGDITTSPNYSGSDSSGGAYANAEANANAEGGQGGNVSIGDININIPSNSGDSSSSDDWQEDVDINLSAFERMINQCMNYWQMVVNLISMLPAEISLSFASLITVVVICRILGR